MSKRKSRKRKLRRETTDRISQFPNSIIHHIMSFLDSPKDRVRISVLSKTWFALTDSFPILDFDIWKFSTALNSYHQDAYVRHEFYKYVEYTTSRFCQQTAITAHTFKLSAASEYMKETDIFDRCLGFINTRGVQVLMIKFFPGQPWLRTHHLSNNFLSASSLTSLTLHGCDLPSSFMVDPVKFKSLKLLHLKCLNLDDEIIKYLITNCPLLEDILVEQCYGLKVFCVSRHQNLQKLVIICQVEIIDIEAPNICEITVVTFHSEAPHMNLASCKKLTTLTYGGPPPSPSKSEMFFNFLSELPFIQNLILRMRMSTKFKVMKLSSSSLRKLVLHWGDVDELDISTPNLLLFEYRGCDNLPALVLRESLPPKAQIAVYARRYDRSLWFPMLKQFFDTENGFKFLKLNLWSRDFLDVGELKVILSPPNELEHIELNLEDLHICGLSVYEAVVDAVLWCCCPRSLKVSLTVYPAMFKNISCKERNQVVKYTYGKLLQQEVDGQISIRIVLSSTSSKAENHFYDLNSSLKASLCVGEEHITFIKEKRYPRRSGIIA